MYIFLSHNRLDCQFQITYAKASDPKLAVVEYEELLYEHLIIFSPSASK